ncbi:peptide MFS transporter [Synoicihabitans lomoniglobus]|uniref:Peptide MFS transporter n=1 Tax=Synoicihabitans lomoniglobus TaxID=2909285 RepID=A0AAF0CPS0_9BACT|nr:peptide MFS transporter [Opitutaceae bacterium LMO-M01]WED65808.1 peptide MFS transporter [Opitutaceae bacterium LMO-M01]
MSQVTSPSAPIDSTSDRGGIGGHPRGLSTLFFTEMWERFSYYGMRALLVLFMTLAIADGGLGLTTERAAAIYGTYTMSVYLLGILGGFLADNFVGSRRAVLWGGVIIASGHYAMAMPTQATFFLGLGLVAIGTGLLKPNISTMVGSLYSPEDARRDAGFSIFYMGINLGSFLSAIACGYLAQAESFRELLSSVGIDPRSCWHFAFGAAGVGMTLGLITYVRRRHTLAHVGHAPEPTADGSRPWGKLGLVAIASAVLIGVMVLADRYKGIVIGLFALQILAILFFAFRPSVESRRIAAILVLFFAAQVFWALFEQAGSSVQLFADRLTDNSIFGWEYPSAWWQSVNAIFVVILAPCFAWLWIRLGTKSPSSPTKFALGLLFVALSFVWMIPAAKLTANGLVSPIWLLGLFFLQTTGEMCLSPVGLSTMTKLAPARLTGLVMGIWFLAAALGNKLAGLLAGSFDENDPASLTDFFLTQAIWVGVATAVLFALVPWVRRLMGGVH